MRPHERRAQQGHSADPDLSEPIIAMPVVGLLEKLEAQFAGKSLLLPTAEETFSWAARMAGQQEVIQFIRNLEAKRSGS